MQVAFSLSLREGLHRSLVLHHCVVGELSTLPHDATTCCMLVQAQTLLSLFVSFADRAPSSLSILSRQKHKRMVDGVTTEPSVPCAGLPCTYLSRHPTSMTGEYQGNITNRFNYGHSRAFKALHTQTTRKNKPVVPVGMTIHLSRVFFSRLC